MWLRDASLEGKLPTIEQMTADPVRVLPLPLRPRAVVATSASAGVTRRSAPSSRARLSGGVEPAFRRTIGLTLEQLSRAVARRGAEAATCPRSARRAKARAGRRRARSPRSGPEGTLHLAPALSPDGIAGRLLQREGLLLRRPVPRRRRRPARSSAGILKSGVSSNYETYRFINSPGELVARRQVPRVRRPSAGRATTSSSSTWRATSRSERIKVKLSGVTTPTWSPDGKQLVFTGYDGGSQRPVHRQPRRVRTSSGSPTTSTPTCTRSGRPTARPSRSRPTAARETDFKTLGVRQLPDRALRPRHRRRSQVLDHMDAGQEREPAVGARTASRSPSCPTGAA